MSTFIVRKCYAVFFYSLEVPRNVKIIMETKDRTELWPIPSWGRRQYIAGNNNNNNNSVAYVRSIQLAIKCFVIAIGSCAAPAGTVNTSVITSAKRFCHQPDHLQPTSPFVIRDSAAQLGKNSSSKPLSGSP